LICFWGFELLILCASVDAAFRYNLHALWRGGFSLQSASQSSIVLCSAFEALYSGGEVFRILANRCTKAIAFVSCFGFMLVFFDTAKMCSSSHVYRPIRDKWQVLGQHWPKKSGGTFWAESKINILITRKDLLLFQ
jgi:hypothetical protein